MMKITRIRGLLTQSIIRSILRDRIKATHSQDPDLVELMEKVYKGKFTNFSLNDEGILWISGRLCVPNMDNLREEILEEA